MDNLILPHSQIFRETNENLTEIFSNYDVQDKDILTVLGSSDQLFSCIYNGAKTIDTFDINILTLYYFYLRKWLITYKNTWYPPYEFFESKDLSTFELIDSINPTDIDSKKTKDFWINYLKTHNYNAKDLFEQKYVIGGVPYLNDIDKIKEKLREPLNFKEIDFKESVNINKKYDIIILSNMLE